MKLKITQHNVSLLKGIATFTGRISIQDQNGNELYNDAVEESVQMGANWSEELKEKVKTSARAIVATYTDHEALEKINKFIKEIENELSV